ncbi:hypothetical protein SRHO_G00001900 [Serrasalmus rhombeus]
MHEKSTTDGWRVIDSTVSQSQRRSHLYIVLNKLKVGGAQCRAATTPARRSRYFSNHRFYFNGRNGSLNFQPRRLGAIIHGGSANFPELGGSAERTELRVVDSVTDLWYGLLKERQGVFTEMPERRSALRGNAVGGREGIACGSRSVS